MRHVSLGQLDILRGKAPSSVAECEFTRIRVEGLVSLVEVTLWIHLVGLRVQLWIVQNGPMGWFLSLTIWATSVGARILPAVPEHNGASRNAVAFIDVFASDIVR